MGITRREFVKTSVALVPAMAVLPAVFRRAVAMAADGPGSTSGPRTLVIVQMAGGNDGLNTVIPYADSRYYDLRPNIAVPQAQVIPLDQQVGLHPSLTRFKDIWDEGKLAIIEGVGYPSPSFSHFQSTDIWQSGDPGGRVKGGWMGRYFQRLGQTQEVFQGLAVARSLPREMEAPNIPVPTLDAVERYQFQGDPGRPGNTAARTEALLKLYSGSSPQAPYAALLEGNAQVAHKSSQALQQADRDYKPGFEYPNTPLARGLKLLAEAITAGLGVRVGHVTIGGFDTHAAQTRDQPGLLKTLGDAVHAFYQDLKAHGKDRDVVVMTWSEFGRRAKSNASDGTDHGAAGPMFVVGTRVKGGLYGARPDLGRLSNDNLGFTTDFRQVYSTLLDRWFGVPPDAILGPGKFPVLGFLPD